MNENLVADAVALLARLISGASIRLVEERSSSNMTDPHAAEVQRVYVANHSSHLDFIVLWSALPAHLRRVTRPVAAKEYWNKSAVRRYLAIKVYRAILIDREVVTANHNPIDLIAGEMGDIYSVIIFPEGTRGSGEEVSAFKSGVYHLVTRKPQLQCVPVYLENLNRVLPKGEILPLPILSSISMGAPVQLHEGENKNAFLQRLRDTVLALKAPE